MTTASVFYTPLLVTIPTANTLPDDATRYLRATHAHTLPPLQWLNTPEDHITIELIRNLGQQLSYAASSTQPQAFGLWGLEHASVPAQNALLKSLEEPPAFTWIILTTSDGGAVLETVRSRCVEVTLSQVVSSDAPLNSLARTYEELRTGSYADVIAHSDELSDRDAATAFLTELLQYAHTQQKLTPSAQLVKQQQTLLQALQELKQNSNVKLTLDRCFFSWVKQ